MTVAKPSSEMLERARKWVLSKYANEPELRDSISLTALAQFGEELVRETARECAEIASNFRQRYTEKAIRQRYNL